MTEQDVAGATPEHVRGALDRGRIDREGPGGGAEVGKIVGAGIGQPHEGAGERRVVRALDAEATWKAEAGADAGEVVGGVV